MLSADSSDYLDERAPLTQHPGFDVGPWYLSADSSDQPLHGLFGRAAIHPGALVRTIKRWAAFRSVRTGDSFVWTWHNWDFEEQGEILEANGRDRLAFAFGKGGKVYLEFKETEEGTELSLAQNEIPTDERSKQDLYVGCATGWTFWLANLKAWLEHGITLHATGLRPAETADLVNS